MNTFVRTIPALVLLGGCFEPTEMEGPQLLTPERVEFYWDQSFNGYDDSLGALVPMDLMVYDGLSGEALRGVSLDISISGGDGLIVEPDSIGFVDVEECSECDYLWDSYRDQYFVIPKGEDPASVMSIDTDATGLARVYVYVDAFVTDTGDVPQLDVRIDMGDVTQIVALVAE